MSEIPPYDDGNDESAEALSLIINDPAHLDNIGDNLDVDWFLFEVTPGSNYSISLNTLSSNYIDVRLYDSALGYSGSTYAYGSGGLQIIGATDSVYYLKVSASNNSTGDYNVAIEDLVISYTTLPLGEWTPGTIETSGDVLWYEANVTGGQAYSYSHDDSFQGSGTYTCDIDVTAYQEDMVTPYFNNLDSAWTSPQTINVPEGESKIYFKVRGYGGGSNKGTFALLLQ